jgi:hypothetical protein
MSVRPFRRRRIAPNHFVTGRCRRRWFCVPFKLGVVGKAAGDHSNVFRLCRSVGQRGKGRSGSREQTFAVYPKSTNSGVIAVKHCRSRCGRSDADVRVIFVNFGHRTPVKPRFRETGMWSPPRSIAVTPMRSSTHVEILEVSIRLFLYVTRSLPRCGIIFSAHTSPALPPCLLGFI